MFALNLLSNQESQLIRKVAGINLIMFVFATQIQLSEQFVKILDKTQPVSGSFNICIHVPESTVNPSQFEGLQYESYERV